MKFCPECGTLLVSQKFCQECGCNISKYTGGNSEPEPNNVSLDSFDFSSLQIEAESQLNEQSGFEVVDGVLVKYHGKDENVIKATNNIQKVSCVDASLLNVAQVVENTYVVFTKNAIKKLEEAYV